MELSGEGTGTVIRDATPDDTKLILAFIMELAEYEKLAEQVVATPEGVRETLFGPDGVAETILAFQDGEPAGFALFFHNYSTFLGRPGLYLEDLFVRKALRGKGIGKRLLRHLAGIAVERCCGRFEWSVLDWNHDALGFYESLGAKPIRGWTVYRLDGDALAGLAARN